jgi:hypothetical protein
MNTREPNLEDVLVAFSVEADAGSATLQRYLNDYPQFSDELIDLSNEIYQFSHVEQGELPSADRERIDAVLAQFRRVASRSSQPSLERLAPARQREHSQALGVPRQVILAFVERGVIANSVPGRFLTRMAEALQSTAPDLHAYLSQDPQRAVRYAKADGKPLDPGQVPFEQLLRDAGLSEAQAADILRDEL